MNKKFYGAVLMGALVMGGAFVSCSDYDDDIKDLQEQINNLNSGTTTSVQDVKNQLSTVQSAAAAAQSAADKANAAAAAAADAAKAAQGTADAAQAAADAAAEAAKAEAKAEALAAVVDELKAVIADMEEGKANADQVERALGVIEGHIEGIDEVLNQLGDDVKANASEIKTLKEAIATLAALEGDQKEQANMLALYDEAINNLGFAIQNMDMLVGNHDQIIADLQESVDAIDEKIGLAVDGVYEKVDILFTLANDLQAEQEKVAKQLGSLSTLNVMIAKRPTSLVFAPTTYINGIEAIKFENLKYTAWGDVKKVTPNTTKNFAIDKVGAVAEYIVNPATVKEDAFASLSFVANTATNTRAPKAAGIAVSSYKINGGVLTANLKKTDAANWGTPSTHAAGTIDTPESMTIVSLKAVLSDKVKAAEETGEVAVYSDWARVVETTETPIIDNAQLIKHVGKANWSYADDRKNEAVANHFWHYDAVYPELTHKGATKENPVNKAEETKYIVKQVSYKQPVDLLSLVRVCTYTGTSGVDAVLTNTFYTVEQAAEMGLTWNFTVEPYWFWNEADTKDATNQAKFGKIVNEHFLQSTAENGLENNADAVGRTPLVKAQLMDGENIVDVVYFKIQWAAVDTPAKAEAWDECAIPALAYNCLGAYDGWVYEEYMNNLYAKIVEGGYSKNVFHSIYNLEGRLYAGKVTDAVIADVAKGDLTKYNTIGMVKDVEDEDAATQTHNIEIQVTPFGAINPEFEQDFEKDAFFFFTSGLHQIVIPVKISVKAGVYSNAVNYFQSQWSTKENTIRGYVDNNFNVVGDINKFRSVNPTLWSDSKKGLDGGFATTQLTGSLAFGYVVPGTGAAPTDINSLVAYTPYKGTKTTVASDIVFDDSRLMLLPNGKWHVEAAGKELWDGTIKAAEIKGVDVYLVDNASATGTTGAADAQPTEAALRLVGVKVPVKVLATNCEESVFDQYLVDFIKPLVFNGLDKDLSLIDVKNGADSEPIGIANIITLKENFGQNSAQIYIFGAKKSDPENMKLVKWYEVEDVVIDTDADNVVLNAMTDLNLNGGKDAACNTLLSKVKNEYGEQSYIVKYDKATDKLSFHNASGNAIAKDYSFKVELPVTVDTKWQKGLKANVVVTIKSGL